MGRKRVGRRALLKASGLAGAVGVGAYGMPDGLVEYAAQLPVELTAAVGRSVERANEPPEFGPRGRPNAGSGDPARDSHSVGPSHHDVYVVCHKHPDADADQYGTVLDTLRDAADYHSSWREFDVAVVDAGEDLPDDLPEFGNDAIYEYPRDRLGVYSTSHDVHLLVFDNPWFRVGKAVGKVGWEGQREPWSVAVLAAGLARAQSEPYMRAMALHEVGHTFIRGSGGGSDGFVDGHEAGGTVRDEDEEVEEIYPMSSTYVLDADGDCDVAGVACSDDLDPPETFVGCKNNAAGDGFAEPLYRNLFWANRRTHGGTRCPVADPRPDDERPGFTEDELALTVRERLR